MTLNIYAGLIAFAIPLLSASMIAYVKELLKYRGENGENVNIIVSCISAIFSSLCFGVICIGLHFITSFSSVDCFGISVFITGIINLDVIYLSYKTKKGYNNENKIEKVYLTMSPKEYKEMILEVENDSKEILLLSKRLTVMFKSEEMIGEMAKKRFGEGSPHIAAYKDEHMRRKASFFKALDDGCQIYEIHNRAELENYIYKRKHVGIGSMDSRYILEMLENWKRTMHDYPNNYYVAITDESIPFKYELVNEKWMVIHESVGAQSDQRLNALIIHSDELIKNVRKDFFAIWERTSNENKEKSKIIEWIDKAIQEINDTVHE